MVDNAPTGGGKPIVVFESGAIMMYIAEKAGKFYPQDLRTKHEVNQWLIWQMANQGPKTRRVRTFPPRRPGQGRRPDLRHHPLHRRGEPPLRRAEQPALQAQVSRRRPVHDRRHDLLPVDGELEVPGPGHRGVQATSSAGSRSWARAPPCRRAWRSAPTSRSIARSCRPRSRRASARCSTTSAPGPCRVGLSVQTLLARERRRHLLQRLALRRDAELQRHQRRRDHQRGAQHVAADMISPRAAAGDQHAEQPRPADAARSSVPKA